MIFHFIHDQNVSIKDVAIPRCSYCFLSLLIVVMMNILFNDHQSPSLWVRQQLKSTLIILSSESHHGKKDPPEMTTDVLVSKIESQEDSSDVSL